MADSFVNDKYVERNDKSVTFTVNIQCIVDRGRGDRVSDVFPIYEIPVIQRKMLDHGGDVIIDPKWPLSLKNFREKQLTKQNVSEVIENLTEKYGHMTAHGPENYFEDVYGKGRDSVFVPKLNDVARAWGKLMKLDRPINEADVMGVIGICQPDQMDDDDFDGIDMSMLQMDDDNKKVEATDEQKEESTDAGEQPSEKPNSKPPGLENLLSDEELDALSEPAIDGALLQHLEAYEHDGETARAFIKAVTHYGAPDAITPDAWKDIPYIKDNKAKQKKIIKHYEEYSQDAVES